MRKLSFFLCQTENGLEVRWRKHLSVRIIGMAEVDQRMRKKFLFDLL